MDWSPSLFISEFSNELSHNHIDHHYHLSDKKTLFKNLTNYCKTKALDPFDYIPVTFHLEKGVNNTAFVDFMNYFEKIQ